MFCKMCGKPTGSDADMCTECQAMFAQPAVEPVVEPTVTPVASQPEPQPTVMPTAPVKTSSVLTFSIISKILIVLAFIGAVVSFISIISIVVLYNMEYGFQTISPSQLSELLVTAELYKGYAIILIFTALSSIIVAIPALVMAKINKNKGFPSKLVKVFFILTIAFGCAAIANCTLNYFLFGRYETVYYYI